MPLDTDRLLAALTAWNLPVASAEPLPGGWNSVTWLVRTAPGTRYVAKLSDVGSATAFLGGLRVAARAERGGLASGAPVPLPGGRLAADLDEGLLALLRYVPGRPPDSSSADDLHRMGAVLARAHHALGNDIADVGRQHRWPWPWASDCLRELPMAPHVRTAAARVLEEAREAAPHLRAGVVNGDPGLDGFRLSARSPEEDGLVDWGAVLQAPILYDLASAAVLTRDTPHAIRHIVAGYRAVDPAIDDELPHLGTFVRLRWMAHAIYFSDRIERGLLRGVTSAAGNEEGLEEAYAGMRGR
ncbi:phosphotransferase [Nonomuraea sp. B1E8]|uniref:phosphotransferase enzyme family protein n=1 Tax=unclassified Nonomuraea TaxID=2593643 RepID=UPI00325EB3F3